MDGFNTMKKCLLCLLVPFLLAPCVAEGKEVQAYLDEAARLYREKPENIASAVKVLNDGLAEHPDAVSLLEFRGNLYCSHGKLPECRADTLQMQRLKPGAVEPRMMLCMLNEFEGASRQACDACYGEIVTLLAATPASSPEGKLSDRFNYVFALLMARHPEAEREKTAFLAQGASDPQEWFYRGLLEDFDRTRALRQIFGQ